MTCHPHIRDTRLSVSEEFWTDLAQLLSAGAIIAAIGLPLGLVAWISARRSGKSLLLPWKPWRAPWGGFEVVFAFLLVNIVPLIIAVGLAASGDYSPEAAHPMPSVEATAAIAGMPVASAIQEQQAETTAMLRGLMASVVAFPFLLTLFFVASRIYYPTWRVEFRHTLASHVALAVFAWALLTPIVLGVNAVVNALFIHFDLPRAAHPLTKLAGRPLLDSALFVFQACIAAPVIEELMFRGVILAWAIGGRKPTPIPDIPSKIRPWLITLAGLFFAAKSGWREATVFSLILLAGQAGLTYFSRSKRRMVSAVYSSAAFFALVHSTVWPSPIPLFLLGLGLGWLAVRTRGVLVPAIVHGLFNAVSTVMVLRSAG